MPMEVPMSDEAFHVRLVGSSWRVIDGGGRQHGEPLRTRGDAVGHAKELARRAGLAQVLVYGDSGKLESEFFYGRDERRALARDDGVSSLAATHPAHR
jgi:hypothetical protein